VIGEPSVADNVGSAATVVVSVISVAVVVEGVVSPAVVLTRTSVSEAQAIKETAVSVANTPRRA
jgi:hypothetical protein